MRKWPCGFRGGYYEKPNYNCITVNRGNGSTNAEINMVSFRLMIYF